MKHERLYTTLLSTLLSIGIAVAAISCAVTGFHLTFAAQQAIVWTLLGGAAAFSLLLGRRHGHIPVLCLLALWGGYLWHQGTLLLQSQALAYHISLWMDEAYHWGYLLVPEKAQAISSFDQPVTVYGLLLECAVCRSISRRKSPLLPILLAAVPIILCLMVPHAVPATWALFLLLTLAALLLLTSGVRRESSSQGNRLTLAVLVPVLAAVSLLLYCCPQDTYVDHTEQIRQDILVWAQGMTDHLPETNGTFTFTPPERTRSRVNLAALNGQDNQDIPVMKVRSQRGGTLYLRGQDYDIYTGTGWESTRKRTEDFSGWGEKLEDITLCTFAPHELLYVPYFPGSGTTLTDGTLPNSQHQLEYTFSRYASGSAASEELLSRCLELPVSTAEGLEKFLPAYPGTISGQAAQIAQLVSHSAQYDRATPKMPASQDDFALWFLRDSDLGYCVHFATAATVLLRASGIPARYVTGYKAETTAGDECVVTGLQAHAWAEYYDPAYGNWILLEATPADTDDSTDTSVGTPETSQPTDAPTQPTADPPVQTQPTQTQPEAPAPTARRSKAPLLIPPVILFLAAGIWLRRWALLTWRGWLHKRADANRKALLAWQDVLRLAALRKEEPPESLQELAEKARFSPYTLTPEELDLFSQYRTQSLGILRDKPWYFHLLYQYILVKY